MALLGNCLLLLIEWPSIRERMSLVKVLKSPLLYERPELSEESERLVANGRFYWIVYIPSAA
jgi:hypothetical protein